MAVEKENPETLTIKKAYELADSYAKQAAQKNEFLFFNEVNPDEYPEYSEYMLQVKIHKAGIHRHLRTLEDAGKASFQLPADSEIIDEKPSIHNLLELKIALDNITKDIPINSRKLIGLEELKAIAREAYTKGQTQESFEVVKNEYHFPNVYKKALDEQFYNLNEKLMILQTLKRDGISMEEFAYKNIKSPPTPDHELAPIDKIRVLNDKAFQELQKMPFPQVEQARNYVRGYGMER